MAACTLENPLIVLYILENMNLTKNSVIVAIWQSSHLFLHSQTSDQAMTAQCFIPSTLFSNYTADDGSKLYIKALSWYNAINMCSISANNTYHSEWKYSNNELTIKSLYTQCTIPGLALSNTNNLLYIDFDTSPCHYSIILQQRVFEETVDSIVTFGCERINFTFTKLKTLVIAGIGSPHGKIEATIGHTSQAMLHVHTWGDTKLPDNEISATFLVTHLRSAIPASSHAGISPSTLTKSSKVASSSKHSTVFSDAISIQLNDSHQLRVVKYIKAPNSNLELTFIINSLHNYF